MNSLPTSSQESPEQPQTKPNEKSKSLIILDLLKTFADRTTAVGPAHVKNSPLFIGRLIWALALLAGIILTLYQAALKIDFFYQYQTQVVMTEEYATKLTFPAITFCNLNPYRSAVLQVVSPSTFAKLSGMLGSSPGGQSPNGQGSGGQSQSPSGQGSGATPPLGAATAPQNLNLSLIEQIEAMDASQKAAWDLQANKTDTASDFGKLLTAILIELSVLNETDRHRMGHSLETMLIFCNYNGKICGPEDLELLLNWRYGNCYTFNGGWNGSSVKDAVQSGTDYGLSLYLYLQSDQYVTGITDTVGIRIIVHDQNQVPFPEDEGVLVSAGARTQLAIKQVNHVRPPAPASPGCMESCDNETSFYYDSRPAVQYQQRTCSRTCLQNKVVRDCKCKLTGYPGPSTVPGCVFVTNPSEPSCPGEIVAAYQSGNLECTCPPSCNERTFTVSTSSATWPESHTWALLKNKIELNFPYLKNTGINLTWARENMVRADIFFPEFSYQTITESLSYDKLSLLSDIGGVIGFWIGLSVASLLELLEFGVLIIVTLCSTIASRGASLKKIKVEPRN